VLLETIVNLIANTTTEAGLEVRASEDTKIYKKGIKISDEEFKTIKITRDNFKGKWNYTIAT
jgi:hypothetical protein